MQVVRLDDRFSRHTPLKPRGRVPFGADQSDNVSRQIKGLLDEIATVLQHRNPGENGYFIEYKGMPRLGTTRFWWQTPPPREARVPNYKVAHTISVELNEDMTTPDWQQLQTATVYIREPKMGWEMILNRQTGELLAQTPTIAFHHPNAKQHTTPPSLRITEDGQTYDIPLTPQNTAHAYALAYQALQRLKQVLAGAQPISKQYQLGPVGPVWA